MQRNIRKTAGKKNLHESNAKDLLHFVTNFTSFVNHNLAQFLQIFNGFLLSILRVPYV